MAWQIIANGDSADEAGLWAGLKHVLTDARAGTQFANFAGETMAGQFPPSTDELLADARAQLADKDAQLEAAAERIASLQGELSVAQTVNQIAAANAVHQEAVTP